MEVTSQISVSKPQEEDNYLKPDYWIPCCQRCNKLLQISSEKYKAMITNEPATIKQLLSSSTITSKTIDLIVIPETFEDFCVALTDLYDVEFPLCNNCLEKLNKECFNKSTTLKNNVDTLLSTIAKINNNSKPELQISSYNIPEDTDYEDLKLKSLEYPQKIEQMKSNLASLYNRRILCQRNKEDITQIENDILDQYNEISKRINAVKMDRDHMQLYENSIIKQLDSLKHSNAVNDTYYIWFDDAVGLINTFPLGKHPNKNPDFIKINYAFNELVNCVYSISILTEIGFSNIALIPCGAESTLRYKPDNSSYSLSLNPTKSNRKVFLQGFQYFILGFIELIQHMKEKYNIEVPYEITEFTIGGYEHNMNDLDVWTHAMKLLLIDVKKLYLFTIMNKEKNPTPIKL